MVSAPIYQTLLYGVEGNVAVITFNRPKQMNALSQRMMLELKHGLEQADQGPHSDPIKQGNVT